MVYSDNTSTTTFKIEGGYTLVPLSRLGNALGAFIAGVITLAEFKAFFALLEMAAIREAAKYRGRTTGDKICYEHEEIRNYVDSTENYSPRTSIKRLEAHNLVQFTPQAVTFTDTPLQFAYEVIENLAGGRSPRRLIPIPRRVIKFLAACNQPAMLKAITAILIRGLTYKKGIINLAGSCKSSWVASIVGISLRAAKYARMFLIKVGLISLDTGSTQRKLNRTGAYFVVNPSWNPNCPQMIPEPVDAPSQAQEISSVPTIEEVPTVEEAVMPITGENEAVPVDNSVLPEVEFAPPAPLKCTEFAPPLKDKEPSKEANKDQKPLPSALRSGVYKTPSQNPKLNAIEKFDLMNFIRCELLYWQAVNRGWINHNEANVLNWLSAAVRAKEVARKQGGDPVRIFVTIVKKKLWHLITNEQEDYARQVLLKFRNQNEDYYRRKPEERSTSNVPRLLGTLTGTFSAVGKCFDRLLNPS